MIKTKIKIVDLFSTFQKLKVDEKICFFKGNLGDLTDQISTPAKKKYRKKQTATFIFYRKSNLDLKFVFQFDNENGN